MDKHAEATLWGVATLVSLLGMLLVTEAPVWAYFLAAVIIAESGTVQSSVE